MCGRYSLDIRPDFADRFLLSSFPSGLQSNHTIAPSQKLPVIVHEERNELEMMTWGLIPPWSKDGKPGVINARVETLTEKPMFRNLIARNRCLVPATGFYEWKKTEEGKVPYYLHLPNDEYFSFAGLYSEWRNPRGEVINSYTIITTEADSTMRQIHDRMPVILPRQYEEKWLDTSKNAETIPLSILRNPEPIFFEPHPTIP